MNHILKNMFCKLNHLEHENELSQANENLIKFGLKLSKTYGGFWILENLFISVLFFTLNHMLNSGRILEIESVFKSTV